MTQVIKKLISELCSEIKTSFKLDKTLLISFCYGKFFVFDSSSVDQADKSIITGSNKNESNLFLHYKEFKSMQETKKLV